MGELATDRADRDHGLQATPAAAAAPVDGAQHLGMADLPGDTDRAAVRLSVEDEAGADAVRHLDVDEIVPPAGCAEDPFAAGAHVRVVAVHHSLAQAAAQFAGRIDIHPARRLGATSARYVWAALGPVPADTRHPPAGRGRYPFPNITVQLGSGGRWEISAPSAGADRPYVGRLTVNGRPVSRPWLTLDPIPQATLSEVVPIDRRVTHLGFQLSDRPDRDWGAAPADAPPSGMDLAAS